MIWIKLWWNTFWYKWLIHFKNFLDPHLLIWVSSNRSKLFLSLSHRNRAHTSQTLYKHPLWVMTTLQVPIHPRRSVAVRDYERKARSALRFFYFIRFPYVKVYINSILEKLKHICWNYFSRLFLQKDILFNHVLSKSRKRLSFFLPLF